MDHRREGCPVMDEMDMLGGMDAPTAGDTAQSPPGDGEAVVSAKKHLEEAHTALETAEEQVRAAQEKSDQDLSGWLRAAASEALAQNQRTRDRAVADVENAADELAQAQSGATTHQAGAGNTDPQPAAETKLAYDSAEEFLHEYLLPLYNRPIDARNGKWCAQWFLHAEAVSRVDALWRAWEHLRLDPATGLSVWWKDHADVHMAVLLSQKGPFYACSSTRHNAPEPFPCEMAPEGWLPKASETPDP